MLLRKLWDVKIKWINRYDEEWNRNATSQQKKWYFPDVFQLEDSKT